MPDSDMDVHDALRLGDVDDDLGESAGMRRYSGRKEGRRV
jgi:hypothetical protein